VKNSVVVDEKVRCRYLGQGSLCALDRPHFAYVFQVYQVLCRLPVDVKHLSGIIGVKFNASSFDCRLFI